MAQVFGTDVKQVTRPNALQLDSKPLNFKSLNQKAMPTPTALAGTTGIDASLVHGDVWRELKGNETIDILKNLKTTITQDELRALTGNLKNTVTGTTNDTRVGAHHQQNVAPRFEIYTHTLFQDHHEKMVVHQPTSTWDTVSKYFAFKAAIFNATGVELTAKGSANTVTAMDVAHKTISLDNKVFAAKKESFAIKDLDLGTHLGGALTEIKALKVKAAASHMKAIAANLNAGVAANADSPFA